MIKVGEYIRTPYGKIGKITNIPKHNKYFDDGFYLENEFIECGSEAMKQLKSTPNIIDLIEVGDYVNGYKVTSIYVHPKNKKICIEIDRMDYDGRSFIDFDGIKSIVTKEQFESMEYKVGE